MVLWKEAGREMRGLRLVDDLAADLRYATRTMRRAPGFTAAAVVSLAFGIGAATAIFGLFDLLLLKPLPVSNPHELVHVTTAGERGEANSGSSNYPWFKEVASRTDLVSDACSSGTTSTRLVSAEASSPSQASASPRTITASSAFGPCSAARSRQPTDRKPVGSLWL